jgi:hypothetical protein
MFDVTERVRTGLYLVDTDIVNSLTSPPQHFGCLLPSAVFCNIIYLFTAIGLSPGGSGYFACKQNMKLATTKFKSGGLHEKHVVATWNVGNRLSICL